MSKRPEDGRWEREMRSWSVHFPEGIRTSDLWLKECSLACVKRRAFCLCLIFRQWRGLSLRDGGMATTQRVGDGGGVITRRGAEGWELDGYFILSIGVCKWKCQSGRKTNESDRRVATSLAKCLINCHCLLRALMFFVVIFLMFFVCLFAVKS